MIISGWPTVCVIILGILVRSILLFGSEWNVFLSRHVFLATPASAFIQIPESVFLMHLGESPYAGDILHQPPLVVLFFYVLDMVSLGDVSIKILFMAVDVWIMYLLYNFCLRFLNQNAQQAFFFAALYFLNPITITSCASMSLSLFVDLFLVLTLSYGMKRKLSYTALSLCMACYMDCSYISLIWPTGILFFKNRVMKFLLLCFVWLSALLLTSYSAFESTEFLYQSYGAIIMMKDLTPNMGVWWYFFTEIFDRFRPLFLIVFNTHIWIYIYPTVLRLEKVPLFAMTVLSCMIALYKPYPTLGQMVLNLLLLSMHYKQITPLTPRLYVSMFLCVLSCCLAYVFWFLWIYPQSGNANFVFFQTIIFHAACSLLLTEVVGLVRCNIDK